MPPTAPVGTSGATTGSIGVPACRLRRRDPLCWTAVRIATWNVNSARARKPRLLNWLDQRRPDVVCQQETKTTDAEFAETFGADLAGRGYAVAHRGQRGWNGVAILSRAGLDDVTAAFALHGIGSAEPWIHATGPDAYHATAAGYRAYSQAIRSEL